MTAIFSKLPIAVLPVQGGDLMMIDQQDSTAPFGYTTRKVSAQQLVGAATVLTSIAGLRLRLAAALAPFCFVVGYYAAGDGGGGNYYYDSTDTTSADNGGTIIVGVGGARWKLSSQAVINVKQFGAKGDGSTDDTARGQAAINALGGRALYWPTPSVNYRLTGGGLSITTPYVRMYGDGLFASQLVNASTTGSVISVSSDGSFEAEEMGFAGASAATGGSVISLTGASTQNAYTTISRCLIQGGYYGISTTAACLFKIVDNEFSGFAHAGVLVQNTYSSDSGDSQICGNTFGNASGALACVLQYSSGGLRITNNKFNTGQYHYLLQLQGVTSDLLISSNSMENASVACIALSYASGSFDNIAIVGNQCARVPSWLLMNDPNLFFNKAVIGNNMVSAVTNFGILLDNASQVTINGNTITGLLTAGSIGIKLGASTVNPTIGVNTILNFVTRVQNLSTAGAVTMFSRPLLMAANGSAVANSTSELVTARANIAVGMMDVTSGLKGFAAWQVANTANNKVLRLRATSSIGTVLWSTTVTTATNVRLDFMLSNVSAENIQILVATLNIDGTITPVTITVPTIDFTLQQALVFTVQKDVGNESVTPFMAYVELLS